MFAAISPSEAAPLPGDADSDRDGGAASLPVPVPVHGIGTVGFALKDGATRLKDLYQQDPVRVLFPTPARGEIPTAVFVTTSGGLVGGDVLGLGAGVQANAAALVTAQAAEKIYRSKGGLCRIDLRLRVEPGGWLEWLPQETILFEGARMKRRTVASVASGGRLLAGEFIVLGRQAMGETVTHGLVRDDWQVRRDGRLVWADALCLDGDISALTEHPAGLGGAIAIATAVFVADDAPDYLDAARDLLSGSSGRVRCGATAVNGILVVRVMGADPFEIREAYGNFWAAFRHAAAGLPGQLPRLWHI